MDATLSPAAGLVDRLSGLVFGGNVFGWTVDEAAAFALLDQFVDAGMSCIDTADHYSNWVGDHVGGESEAVIGRWFARRGRSDDITLITKVGQPMGPRGDGEGGAGLGRAHIMRSIEGSLRRLQRDYVDVYMAHIDDLDTPTEETLEAFTRLVEQGKVRAIAASQFSMERLTAALSISETAGFARFELLETLYNLYDRAEFETLALPTVQAHGLAVLPYFGLAAGFLTGKYRSESDLAGRARAFRVKTYMTERGMRILPALDEVARRYDATPAQIAIAWLAGRPGVTAPLASATSPKQLSQILGALEMRLDPASLALLETASRY